MPATLLTAFAPVKEQFGTLWRQGSDSLDAQRRALDSVADIAWRHADKLRQGVRAQANDVGGQLNREYLSARFGAGPLQWAQDWAAYWTDAVQRQWLTLDAFRQRGNNFVAHVAQGMPPVLDFEHEVVIDGRELERPVNYTLLRIVPPEGVTINPARRPVVIVDPRAGHGAGIGGFKADSQVGEAFEDGHPVYFVAFRPVPEPGQTLADVRDAEIEFLRAVIERHPDAPKPAVIGNCQGGWATMVLAASAPELVGPVVINGAPMSYWAGKTGQNPMRYSGGLLGGAVPALMASDLGNGVFDGSWLVLNFENLNPSNSLFRKYYHLYANVDTEAPRFLEFERWWGGFFLMNEPEIRWIVENLFIGNRLARGEAELGGERIDLRSIRSPIIVFASHGDNITPPQQALNWIADLYSDVDEIKARGQRIVYMLHQSIGHLGIFVSGSVANREHDAITDTMRAVEALAPGLYEMRLDDAEDRVHIRFEPRTIDDILDIDDGREDEELFASVTRLSELGTEVYDLMLRPWVQATVTPTSAKWLRDLQPTRLRIVGFSDQNPLMTMVGTVADQVRDARQPVSSDNPLLALERTGAKWIESQLDLWRDWRDGWAETVFHALYGMPLLKSIGRKLLDDAQSRHVKDLRLLPEVREALATLTEGGAAEGTARMLCLMARARGYVRRSRLERQVQAYEASGVLGRMSREALARLVHRQSIIVDFEPELAMSTLPLLLDTDAERRDALALLMDIVGPRETMHPAAQLLYQKFETLLGHGAAPPDLERESAGFNIAAAAAGTPVVPLLLPIDVDGDADEDEDGDVVPRAPKLDRRGNGAGAGDDLEALRGIGPRMAERMRTLGLRRFEQLARLDASEVAWLDLKLGARGRIRRERWCEQARELIGGGAVAESA
jgi:predicted flap endonuclease-1-like 5' DNA nuclease/pimeloyl-ACP methyl ester carboxylesterase